ncbi:MAG: hypothetical protein J3R72DRAFT_436370, partial [Linnemannia gamsii]
MWLCSAYGINCLLCSSRSHEPPVVFQYCYLSLRLLSSLSCTCTLVHNTQRIIHATHRLIDCLQLFFFFCFPFFTSLTFFPAFPLFGTQCKVHYFFSLSCLCLFVSVIVCIRFFLLNCAFFQ